MKKMQSNSHVDKTAIKKYVDSQVKTMRKYGTRVSAVRYRSIINKVTQAVASSSR